MTSYRVSMTGTDNGKMLQSFLLHWLHMHHLLMGAILQTFLKCLFVYCAYFTTCHEARSFLRVRLSHAHLPSFT